VTAADRQFSPTRASAPLVACAHSPSELRRRSRVSRRPLPSPQGRALQRSTVGFHVVGVQTVEEIRDRPLGSEHVKGHVRPVLRNDLVFELRL
jgi:hypothetical protein